MPCAVGDFGLFTSSWLVRTGGLRNLMTLTDPRQPLCKTHVIDGRVKSDH